MRFEEQNPLTTSMNLGSIGKLPRITRPGSEIDEKTGLRTIGASFESLLST